MAAPGRLRWNAEVEAEIQAGLRKQDPAARIYERLERKFPPRQIQIPSDSAIRRRVRSERERRREHWKPIGDPLDGAVLEVFTQVATKYESVSVLSKLQGEALARVLRLAPDLPPIVAWNFAHEYTYAGEEAEHLDFAIGVARQVKEISWPLTGGVIYGLDGRNEPRPTVIAHVRIHRDRWPERPFCAWAGGSDTWFSYMTALGFPFFEPPEREPDAREAEYDKETWWLWTARAMPPERETGS
jgi:hypothetical protein